MLHPTSDDFFERSLAPADFGLLFLSCAVIEVTMRDRVAAERDEWLTREARQFLCRHTAIKRPGPGIDPGEAAQLFEDIQLRWLGERTQCHMQLEKEILA